MEYHEAADYLTSLQQHRPKLGLDTTARMLAHLGDPQDEVDWVQIAGSNGKGSTARILDSAFRTGGLDVGLFTSPRLNDVREQVRVNGRKIPTERLAEILTELKPCIEHLRADDDMPTHFEVLTTLAIAHFGAADVDVGVLEVGIGGRYDATSVVDPVAAAVTSVSLEHTELLGETVEEIARDKAQVAPSGAPLVTGASGDALAAIRGETDVVTVGGADADVHAVEDGMRSEIESHVSITGTDWALESRLPLLGAHQATNAGVASVLARQVAGLSTSTIAEGLQGATWPGRFEIRSTDPMVVLDGSHNPGAAATLRDLVGRYAYDDLHVVFAAMRDKNHERMVAAYPDVDTAYTTRPDNDRAADPAALAATFEGHADTIHQIPSVPEATERAIASADPDDFVLVTGSLYAVAEARDRWTRLLVPKDRGRRLSRDAVFTGAAFQEATVEAVDTRVFNAYLRKEQARTVAEHLEAIGGTCLRSTTGAPGKFVVTVLSGTGPQLRTLADAIAEGGDGLAHLSRQLREAVDAGRSRPGSWDAVETDRTAVMGVLNVTPDSFYDGGEYDRLDAAVERAEEMVAEGADVVDVGGESTRPGADPVSVEEEIERVVPVIEALSSLEVPVSVDTRKAAVADAALSAGADVVNDVSGLSDPEMRFIVADHDASLVVMHSQSTPVDPDRSTSYGDVVEDVLYELNERVLLGEQAGIDRERIVVDPGCGFGKRPAESFELVDRVAEFQALGCPVMVGHSRKSMYERVGCGSGERLAPTLALTAMAAERGADVVRVHDVAENAAVVRSVAAMNGG